MEAVTRKYFRPLRRNQPTEWVTFLNSIFFLSNMYLSAILPSYLLVTTNRRLAGKVPVSSSRWRTIAEYSALDIERSR